VKSNICYTHGRCNVHVELFSLNNVTNGIKISHANLAHCDYNVILDDDNIKIEKNILIFQKVKSLMKDHANML